MEEQNPTPPMFSIITVTRNHLDGLKATQQSLLAQIRRDFEWIIIDGASEDGTIEYLKNMTLDEPLFTLSEPDAGLYEAMNKGIKKSSGQYVLFLNSGDTFATDQTLENITKACTKNPDFIYGDSLENHKNKIHYKRANPAKKVIWGMFTHHQSMLYKRSIISENDLRYRQIYSIAGDYDFTLRFLQLAKKSLHIPIPICTFELGGLSQQNAFEGRRQQYIIRGTLRVGPQYLNFLVFAVQTLSWNLRVHAPPLYYALKTLAGIASAFTTPSKKGETKKNNVSIK